LASGYQAVTAWPTVSFDRGKGKKEHAMSRWKHGRAVLVALAVGCAILGARAWSQAPAQPSLRVAVVNMTRVWDGYQKRVSLDGKLTQLRETKAQTLRQKTEEITQLSQKLELLAPGSTQRDQADRELQQKQVESRNLTDLSTQEVARKYLEYWDIVYNDICAATDKVAQQEGYDLVLKRVDRRPRTGSLQELQGKIEGMTVLYASSRLDLTEKVLTSLNEEFARAPETKESPQ
jgi:Skp family chaperone for outer membrane proteins